MNTDAENLYQAALKLPGDERYHLAYRLLDSLEVERAPDSRGERRDYLRNYLVSAAR